MEYRKEKCSSKRLKNSYSSTKGLDWSDSVEFWNLLASSLSARSFTSEKSVIDLCLTAAVLCGLAISSKLPTRLIPTLSFNIPKLGKLGLALEASSLALFIALPILLWLSWSLLSFSSLMNLDCSKIASFLWNHLRIRQLTLQFLRNRDTHYPHSGPPSPRGGAGPWRGCWGPRPRPCRPSRQHGTQSLADCCSWLGSASTARYMGGCRSGDWKYSW